MTVAAGFEPGKSDNSVPKTEKSSGALAVDVVAEEGPFGVSKDREYIGAAATRQRFEWPEGVGPTAVFIKVFTATAGSDKYESIDITYDPESVAVSIANLAQSNPGMDVNMQNENITAEDGWVLKRFTSPLRYMDFITGGTGTVTAVRVKGV